MASNTTVAQLLRYLLAQMSYAEKVEFLQELRTYAIDRGAF